MIVVEDVNVNTLAAKIVDAPVVDGSDDRVTLSPGRWAPIDEWIKTPGVLALVCRFLELYRSTLIGDRSRREAEIMLQTFDQAMPDPADSPDSEITRMANDVMARLARLRSVSRADTIRFATLTDEEWQKLSAAIERYDAAILGLGRLTQNFWAGGPPPAGD